MYTLAFTNYPSYRFYFYFKSNLRSQPEHFELQFTGNVLLLNKECGFFGINENPCRTKMITGKPKWKAYLWPFDITCSAGVYVTLVRDRHFPIWSCFPMMWTITIIFPRSDTQYLVLVQCLHYSQMPQRKSQMFWGNVYRSSECSWTRTLIWSTASCKSDVQVRFARQK